MKKTFIYSIITVLLILLLSANVFAATINSAKATLELVENNICTINITDKAVFEKKIIDYDLEKKEITIGLKVSNNATPPVNDPCEIVLLIDNSDSMKNTISTGGQRLDAVINSAKVLATELLKSNTVKVSVVSFSSANSANVNNLDPNWIDEGTLNDATLRTTLSDSSQTVLSAIDEIKTSNLGFRTNIDAGLTLASQQFSGTIENKYIILLTDGVPNLSLGRGASAYSMEDINNTKNKLTTLSNSGIKIISMMTEQSATTAITETDPETAGSLGTLRDIAEAVFGTPARPTAGKYYYVTDDKIEETISRSILADLITPEDGILTDLDIYDYFPQEIVDNFNFEYVAQPTKGTVSQSINLQHNMIVWHIDSLGYGESATLSYKLTTKSEIDESIINVILNTNKKVDITTDKVLDPNGNKKVITSDVSPKIRLTVPEDPTVAPDPIPKTGLTITLISIILVSIIMSVLLFVRNNRIEK